MDMIKRLSKSACSVFQKTFKAFYVLALLQALLYSCKSVPLTSPDREGDFAQFLYKKSKAPESKYYSCEQVIILINDEEVSKTAKAKVYIQSGSFIYMNLNILGIELGRAEITPDSIKFINRIDKTYYFNKLEGLNSILKLNMTYNQLENLILKGFVFDGYEKFKKFKSHINEDAKSYLYVYNNYDVPGITSYFSKDTFQESNIEIGDSLSDFYLLATLLNYPDPGSYPKEIVVTLKKREYKAEVNIEIGKISNNKIGSRSFEVNKKYREIEF
jgi:hypothetical protein